MNNLFRKERKNKGAITDQKDTGNGIKHTIINRSERIPLFLIFLYMVLEFVPDLGAVDVMGPQWVYLSMINLLCVFYFISSRKIDPAIALRKVSGSIISIIFFALLLVCGISIFGAINKTESVVCYARLLVNAMMYFNIAVLLYGRLNLFKLLAQLISIILLIQSFQVLHQFFGELNETEWDKHILNLRLNAGHKNILAASMAIKLPFLIYCIYSSKFLSRAGNIMILFLALLAVSFLNARSAYLIVILQLLLYTGYCLYQYSRERKWHQTIFRIGYFLLPMLLSVFISSLIINNIKGSQETETKYGTVTERLGTMSFTVEGSESRLFFWGNAIDYLKKNPIMGSGFGNWKLAAIPYEKNKLNDLKVGYHVHNDFLEIPAEAGLSGGVLYLSLFVIAAIYLLRVILSGSDNQLKILASIVLMGEAGYFTDAFFNFPLDRPVMQFYSGFLFALVVNISFLNNKKNEKHEHNNTGSIKNRAGLLLCFLLIPAIVINYLNYKSLVAQKKFNIDIQQEKLQYSFRDIDKAGFPSLPNMNVFCFPIDAIKARYLIEDSAYDKALMLLNKSANVNPYLSYNEYLKGHLFYANDRMDSAFFYAWKAFNMRPRSRANYLLLNTVCLNMRDSANVEKAFLEMISLRNEEWVWREYLNALVILKANKIKLFEIADSAIRLFPGSNQRLKEKKAELQNLPGDQNNIIQSDLQKAKQLILLATELFSRKDYASAAGNFKKAAELNPADYSNFENTGLCYYFMFDFKNAVRWFDKVIGMKVSKDGKAEFYKALSLIYSNKKNEACKWLKIAYAKNFKEAGAQLAIYCNKK